MSIEKRIKKLKELRPSSTSELVAYDNHIAKRLVDDQIILIEHLNKCIELLESSESNVAKVLVESKVVIKKVSEEDGKQIYTNIMSN